MRAIVFAGFAASAAAALLLQTACDQDYAASNEDRHSFMGDVRAYQPAPPSSAEAVPAAAAAPAVPAPAPAPAPAASSAAPAASSSAKAPAASSSAKTPAAQPSGAHATPKM